jgi:hypothetical protein
MSASHALRLSLTRSGERLAFDWLLQPGARELSAASRRSLPSPLGADAMTKVQMMVRKIQIIASVTYQSE